MSLKIDRIGVQNLDKERLETEEMKVRVWHIPSGEQIEIHGHSTQEEFYYVLDETLRVHIGPSGETETHDVGPGTVFAASPDIVRGYENIGDDEGASSSLRHRTYLRAESPKKSCESNLPSGTSFTWIY